MSQELGYFKPMLYKNAPIQEAVFDIRVTTVLNQDITSYENLGKAFLQGYPKEEKVIKVVGAINVSQEKQNVLSTPTVLGSIFSNESGSRKIQIRKDGFTFNMLRPYTKWEDFSSQAFHYWRIYKENVRPLSVNRIALRYVNKIDLPLKDLDFDHYFKNVPKIPEGLPQIFNGFFLQMQIPCDTTSGINANITQTFQNQGSESIPFLLDIDVFKIIVDDTKADLNTEFEKIRNFKNLIFERAITDKTRSLFN